MNISTSLPLIINGQFIRSPKEWNCYKSQVIVFFAALSEKLKQVAAASRKGETSGPIKILIVDDDEDDRILFEEAIAHIAAIIEVISARDGHEMVDMMKNKERPDMIFLDLNMPGKTGKECLAEIRHHSVWKNIPVVIYSTSDNRNDILTTHKEGANLYLHKPTSFSELIRMISKTFTYNWEQMPPLSHHEFLLTHRPAV